MSLARLCYIQEDKRTLAQLCLRSLADKNKTRGMLYTDLLDGNHQFERFTEERFLDNGPRLQLRVSIEKSAVSEILQYLKRQELVELYDGFGLFHPSEWRLTMKGWEVLEAQIAAAPNDASSAS